MYCEVSWTPSSDLATPVIHGGVSKGRLRKRGTGYRATQQDRAYFVVFVDFNSILSQRAEARTYREG